MCLHTHPAMNSVLADACVACFANARIHVESMCQHCADTHVIEFDLTSPAFADSIVVVAKGHSYSHERKFELVCFSNTFLTR